MAGNRDVFKEYIGLDGNPVKAGICIEIEVYYDAEARAGNRHNPRGFKMTVTPVNKTERGSVQRVLLNEVRQTLLECDRYSKKKEQEAIAEAAKVKQSLIAKVLQHGEWFDALRIGV